MDWRETMTTATFISLLLYMTTCSFTPGPGNILALNTTSQYGWKESRRLILGICMGYALVQTICTIGICCLAYRFESVLSVLKYVGGVYMIWLAIHVVRSTPLKDVKNKKPTLKEGMLLQLVNVKIYFYIFTLLSVYFIPNSKTPTELALYGIFAVSVGSVACLTWAFLGMKLQTIYKRHFKLINVILGIFLAYCAFSIVKG
jgi:cysteine/O-acetylserine efflux protein